MLSDNPKFLYMKEIFLTYLTQWRIYRFENKQKWNIRFFKCQLDVDYMDTETGYRKRKYFCRIYGFDQLHDSNGFEFSLLSLTVLVGLVNVPI